MRPFDSFYILKKTIMIIIGTTILTIMNKAKFAKAANTDISCSGLVLQQLVKDNLNVAVCGLVCEGRPFQTNQRFFEWVEAVTGGQMRGISHIQVII